MYVCVFVGGGLSSASLLSQRQTAFLVLADQLHSAQTHPDLTLGGLPSNKPSRPPPQDLLLQHVMPAAAAGRLPLFPELERR